MMVKKVLCCVLKRGLQMWSLLNLMHKARTLRQHEQAHTVHALHTPFCGQQVVPHGFDSTFDCKARFAGPTCVGPGFLSCMCTWPIPLLKPAAEFSPASLFSRLLDLMLILFNSWWVYLCLREWHLWWLMSDTSCTTSCSLERGQSFEVDALYALVRTYVYTQVWHL
jgi:hypothetical protein